MRRLVLLWLSKPASRPGTRYDLPLILQLCAEMRLNCTEQGPNEVAIDLGLGAVLIFRDEPDDDCFAGFEDTSWHTHGDFLLSEEPGPHINLDYMDVLIGLAEKKVLICELWVRDRLVNRPVHRDHIE